MRKIFFFLLLLTLFLVSAVNAAPAEYDAIIVRGDLPYDWTVAQAYSQQAKIPIITTAPDYLNEDTKQQLIGFLRTGHTNLLVFGGEAAIFPTIEKEMVDLGFVTHRIREADRYGTSARVAVELYETSETVVIVNGDGVGDLLNAQNVALQFGSPILYIKQESIPKSVENALRLLGTKEVIIISQVSDGVESELALEFDVKVFPTVNFEDNGSRNLRIFDITLGLVLGAFLSLIFKMKRRESVPFNVMTEDEQRIIIAIEEEGGEMGQDALYRCTGFSRPKISRIVSELVKRDLIEKTQFKRTFKLKIKKELVKD